MSKPLLSSVRDALARASQLLSTHSESGTGRIGNAQRSIRKAKTEIDDYLKERGEKYEDF